MSSDSANSTPDLKWFREVSFGMFIHWGLYAIPAGVWKGRETPVEGEWIMNSMRIPLKEYEQLANKFNPTSFNAEKWVRIAKDAGMKYLVVTAKHHDGFALYHSHCDKYNIYDATPFKRDPLAELAQACAKADIKLGFYYSQDQDWHEPGGSGNIWDFRRKPLVERIEGDMPYPANWRVFGGFRAKDETPAESILKSIPERLTLSGIEGTVKEITIKDGHFNFEPVLCGASPTTGSKEGRVAYAFTKLSVENDTTVTIGAGADWWMEWWLDGKRLLSTVDLGGNISHPIHCGNHTFKLKLSKGEHVLALRFISGSAGADFHIGGPRELRAMGWQPSETTCPATAPEVNLKTAFPQYLEKKVKPQLRELLTNYGPVAIIWFDTPCTITAEQSLDLKNFVHSIQPDCLVSGRVGHELGDYQCLGDNEMPAKPLTGVWEGLGTTNHSWGYKSADHEWKSTKYLLRFLIELTAKNANYILNVGPDATGVVPAPAAKALKGMGKWLKSNGEAIYGAKPLDFVPRTPWGYVTRKERSLYLIALEPTQDGLLTFFGLRNKVKSVRLLGGGQLKFEETHREEFDYHKLSINLPKEALKSRLPFVVAVDTGEPVDINENGYSCVGTMKR